MFISFCDYVFDYDGDGYKGIIFLILKFFWLFLFYFIFICCYDFGWENYFVLKWLFVFRYLGV